MLEIMWVNERNLKIKNKHNYLKLVQCNLEKREANPKGLEPGV